MTEPARPITGGCLCGAVRYEAEGAPSMMGYCFCKDCQKASGSGFIPFMGFAADRVRITGKTLQFASKSWRGSDAVRNSCPVCGGLVFGGIVGVDDSYTIYAGSLDDSSIFRPAIAIFDRDRPAWVPLPPGLKVFDTMPGERPS
jgi:hypothetical protein